MAENTKIDWADDSINFAVGCHETTNPGCKECYAIHRMLPATMNIAPGTVRRTGEDTWKKPLRWQERLAQTGETRTVFGNSLGDFFHKELDDYRTDAWDIIRRTPNLIWIILTQRPGNILSRLPADWDTGYPNVWLGVSASDQQHADKRIPTLLRVPAALHLVSLEPLVNAVTLRDWLKPNDKGRKIGWVITGGMSGKNWRHYPLYPPWVRSLRDQCTASGIPFFFKQLGGPPDNYRAGDQALLDGELWKQIPISTAKPICLPRQSSFL